MVTFSSIPNNVCNNIDFGIDTNEFIAKYPTLAEASRVTGESVDLIRDDARYKRMNVSSKKKFRWRYRDDVKESDKNNGSFFIV